MKEDFFSIFRLGLEERTSGFRWFVRWQDHTDYTERLQNLVEEGEGSDGEDQQGFGIFRCRVQHCKFPGENSQEGESYLGCYDVIEIDKKVYV